MATTQGWKFINDRGDFELENPEMNSYLYFPLGNEAGFMGAITPNLGGDAKTSQNTFLNEPVSAEDLHNRKSTRNFWLNIEGYGPWSCSGASARQTALKFGSNPSEKSKLKAGFLWHALERENSEIGIRSEITSFSPMTQDAVELHRVRITNITTRAIHFVPTAAFPIYGRSADNVRDHRNVTSLLHRGQTSQFGVEVQPTLSFDERGHKTNKVAYSVMGADGNGQSPVGFFPVVEDFIGEGGSYDWPEAVVGSGATMQNAGSAFDGFESIGALRFIEKVLEPGQSVDYIVAQAIQPEGMDGGKLLSPYLKPGAFDRLLEENKNIWKDKLSSVEFQSADRKFDLWMKWVSIQPILRRIYGCSFLPHHDYGRGGRGWRDLWQDCLALLIMEPANVKHLLYNNYGGVRVDGSNATIIGSKPGEFIADRNNIARSWMDHGAWPFLTTQLYLNQTGDLNFLLQKQSYFKDKLTGRSKVVDPDWTPEYGNKQKSASGSLYEGSILEHILLQNVVQFYNVGEHNNLRLEDADWNDALDMAHHEGESVAFSSFYAWNLAEIAKLLRVLKEKQGVGSIELLEEMAVFFKDSADYESPEAKQKLLKDYYQKVRHNVSGKNRKFDIDTLVHDLEKKSAWLSEHIRSQEWIKNKDGYEWFNGYYDDKGQRVEGDFPAGVRMTLTGQVFAIMGQVATDAQVQKASESVTRYLKDPKIGGYRLNSDFREVKLDMGRGFGFAFGHKENGAMFSHMTTMYGNALYQRGFVKQGRDVLDSLYQLSCDFEKSRIYPGIPEYINERRRGMYHYLTGAASWLLLTVLNEVFGVRGYLGDLCLAPRLMSNQFKDNKVSATALFAGKKLQVTFLNPKGLDAGQYKVVSLKLQGKPLEFTLKGNSALVKRSLIEAGAGSELLIEAELG